MHRHTHTHRRACVHTACMHDECPSRCLTIKSQKIMRMGISVFYWFCKDLPALWTLWICLNIVLYQSLGRSTVCGKRNTHKDLCAVKFNINWIAEVRNWKGFPLFYGTLLIREKHTLSLSRDPYFTHSEFNLLCWDTNKWSLVYCFWQHSLILGMWIKLIHFNKNKKSVCYIRMTKSPFFSFKINNLVKHHLHQSIQLSRLQGSCAHILDVHQRTEKYFFSMTCVWISFILYDSFFPRYLLDLTTRVREV